MPPAPHDAQGQSPLSSITLQNLAEIRDTLALQWVSQRIGPRELAITNSLVTPLRSPRTFPKTAGFSRNTATWAVRLARHMEAIYAGSPRCRAGSVQAISYAAPIPSSFKERRVPGIRLNERRSACAPATPTLHWWYKPSLRKAFGWTSISLTLSALAESLVDSPHVGDQRGDCRRCWGAGEWKGKKLGITPALTGRQLVRTQNRPLRHFAPAGRSCLRHWSGPRGWKTGLLIPLQGWIQPLDLGRCPRFPPVRMQARSLCQFRQMARRSSSPVRTLLHPIRIISSSH